MKNSHSILCISDCHITLDNFDVIKQDIQHKITNDISKHTHNSTQTSKTYEYIILAGDLLDQDFEFLNKNEVETLITKTNAFISYLQNKCKTLVVLYGNHDEFFFKKYKHKLTFTPLYSYNINDNTQEYVFFHGHQLDSRYFFHKVMVHFSMYGKMKMVFKRLTSKITDKTTQNKYPRKAIHFKNLRSQHYILSYIKKYFPSTKKQYIFFGHFHYMTQNEFLKDEKNITITTLPAIRDSKKIIKIDNKGITVL